MAKPLNIALGSIESASWQQLRLDWYGRPSRFQAFFRIALSSHTLSYEFYCPQKKPQANLLLQTGSFVEGLWNEDVAELFIKNPEGAYHEFNLSPAGAWWTAAFSRYRKRIDSHPLNSARIENAYGESWWRARLSFSLEELYPASKLSLEGLKFNVASILNPSQPEYLCWGHHSGGEPDFHLDSCFCRALEC